MDPLTFTKAVYCAAAIMQLGVPAAPAVDLEVVPEIPAADCPRDDHVCAALFWGGTETRVVHASARPLLQLAAVEDWSAPFPWSTLVHEGCHYVQWSNGQAWRFNNAETTCRLVATYAATCRPPGKEPQP